MIKYIVKRLILGVPVLLGAVTFVFVVVRVAPGDPAVAMLGPYAPEEVIQAYRTRYGLDDPLWEQYLRFLDGLMRGDLGKSLITGLPVARQVANVLPYTLTLTLAGLIIGLITGVPLGIVAAVKHGRPPDTVMRFFSLTGLSVPSFYLGIVLLYFIGIRLRAFPIVGAGDFSQPISYIKHLFLPGLTLGIVMMAYVTRITRASMLNVLSDDYIRTARAKGVTRRTLLVKHALRNALIPVVSVTSLYTIILMGSSVMIEIVFSRPGLGKLLLQAVEQRDYITLESLIILYSVFAIVVNIVTDIFYAWIDPSISYS